MSVRAEGLAIIDSCAEQAPDTGIIFKRCVAKADPDACYVMTISRKKVQMYLILDLAAFALAHQDVLDRNVQFNGFQAAIHLLSRKHKICDFELDESL